jgi:hypothetical protein
MHIKGVAEFVHTAAVLTSHLADRLDIHRHDGVISTLLALPAVGLDIISCRMLFQHTASSLTIRICF